MRFYLLIIAVFCLTSCSKTELVKSYNENGDVVIQYQALKSDPSIKQGTFERFDNDGHVVETATYADDKLDGERKIYFPTGKLMILETYVQNTFEGPYRRYFESGNLNEEGLYSDNQRIEVWKYYYDLEGNPLKEEIRFKNNLENGPFKEFHPNGTLTAEGTYKDELEDGLTKVYDSTGVLIKEIMYDFGRPVEYRDYRLDTIQ